MKKESLFIILSLVFVVYTACGQSKNAIDKIDSARLIMQQYAKENQFFKIAELYTDDARVNGFDGTCSGISEIRNYWKSIRGKGVNWEWSDLKYGGNDDYITQTGTSLLTLQYGDKKITYSALFSVVWEKQADGSYKIVSDFYRRKKDS